MKKPYLTVDDIKKRYDVGKNRAYRIMQAVRATYGSTLGSGKILLSELEAWEQRCKVEKEE